MTSPVLLEDDAAAASAVSARDSPQEGADPGREAERHRLAEGDQTARGIAAGRRRRAVELRGSWALMSSDSIGSINIDQERPKAHLTVAEHVHERRELDPLLRRERAA